MEHLQERVSHYFETRTEGGNGIFRDYIHAESSSVKIFVFDNDYFNISNHKHAIDSQIHDLQQYSNDLIASSAYMSEDNVHAQLEADFASHFGKECVLTQSGYAANTGLIQAICSHETHVYIDKLTHASFWDGLYSRGTQTHVFAHNDMVDLENKIIKHGPGIIIVDSLYSGHGSFSPIKALVQLKLKHKCILVVDESHTLGVYSKTGLVDLMGYNETVDYITASLAKAYCTRAGVIMGPHSQFIKEKSMHYVFSSALMRNDIIKLRAMFEVIKGADQKRNRLMRASNALRKALLKIVDVEDTPIPSPIICIPTKSEAEMVKLHHHFVSKGIFAAPFFFPATPRKSPNLRVTLHSEITVNDIRTITNATASFFQRSNSVVFSSKL
ncbi:hypothetical protein K7432_017494 [Basidiobolus ranarum]|uniref:Aminotransferase class I/classII large domain-containing protein n=1 Tax=Basidiobolus ranarum TaxID=34480 RepID=A0ABR2WDB3_9FUNG